MNEHYWHNKQVFTKAVEAAHRKVCKAHGGARFDMSYCEQHITVEIFCGACGHSQRWMHRDARAMWGGYIEGWNCAMGHATNVIMGLHKK